MKVDISQFRKRPTFEEVANIVNEDSYKIDLPQRTFIKFQDTQAAVEWQNFRDQSQEGEQLRLQRQVYEANERAAMPPPRARRAVTVVAPGEGPIDAFMSSGEEERGRVRRRGQPPPADVVMRDSSRDDDEPDSGGASGSTSRRQLKRSVSGASTPEDTGRGPGGGGPGAGAAGGEGTKLTSHEVATMMRHFSAENMFAQGKLQEALAQHTQAHAQGFQTQVEALAASIAHESRRADARDQMTRDAMQSLSDTPALQIVRAS